LRFNNNYPLKGEVIKTNSRKEPNIINPETGAYMELDIYIPSLNLALEYQVSLLQNNFLRI